MLKRYSRIGANGLPHAMLGACLLAVLVLCASVCIARAGNAAGLLETDRGLEWQEAYDAVANELFNESAFLGNSMLKIVCEADMLPEADVFFRTSLSVSNTFEKTSEYSDVPIMDEFDKETQYKRIYLVYGLNELGYESYKKFEQRYLKIVAALRDAQPHATLYVISVLPMSRTASERNEYDANMENVGRMNELLQEMCEDNELLYIDSCSSLAGDGGYLPEEAAADGQHLFEPYARIWLDDIKCQTAEYEADAIINGE